MENFVRQIKELAIYLGDFTSLYVDCVMYQTKGVVDSIEKYDNCVLGYDSRYTLNNKFLCLASNQNESPNPYVKAVVENIFPAFDYGEIPDFDPFRDIGGPRSEPECKWKMPYNANSEEYRWIDENFERGYFPVSWRADIHYNPKYSDKIFNRVVERVLQNEELGRKYYNVFWNLFLLAIDEEIYAEKTKDVLSFARLAKFDEAMIRDWCRAVEYVMAGNKISENCDLKCETAEGASFFLHKK